MTSGCRGVFRGHWSRGAASTTLSADERGLTGFAEGEGGDWGGDGDVAWAIEPRSRKLPKPSAERWSVESRENTALTALLLSPTKTKLKDKFSRCKGSLVCGLRNDLHATCSAAQSRQLTSLGDYAARLSVRGALLEPIPTPGRFFPRYGQEK
jgi:hypothetical protein